MIALSCGQIDPGVVADRVVAGLAGRIRPHAPAGEQVGFDQAVGDGHGARRAGMMPVHNACPTFDPMLATGRFWPSRAMA